MKVVQGFLHQPSKEHVFFTFCRESFMVAWVGGWVGGVASYMGARRKEIYGAYP